jgi:hypothetical protein
MDLAAGSGSASVFTPLPEEVFEGKGDQWDVYRSMRAIIGVGDGGWEAYEPRTNVAVCFPLVWLAG